MTPEEAKRISALLTWATKTAPIAMRNLLEFIGEQKTSPSEWQAVLQGIADALDNYPDDLPWEEK